MTPSRPFILRPVGTSLLMVAIVLAGLIGLRFLPIAALPQVDFPTIQVQTSYPGASPEVMSQTVTAPLERQFGQMSGLKRMSSASAAGLSTITLQFNLGVRLDVAEQEVQAAINAANALLPADLPAPPVYAKVNPADAPALTLALTSNTLPLTELHQMANNRLALKISQVSGVGLVTLLGGHKPAIRIQADIRALAAAGLGLDSLRTAITQANANTAKGNIGSATRFYSINSNDQLKSAHDYANLIVAWKNGAPIRLSDVARVVQAQENVRLAAWADLQPAIILNVQRQPGANVIQTVDAIQQRLPELTESLPASVTVTVLSDRTGTIRASIHHVTLELFVAMALVVLVILLFLRSWRATVIASLAVPISLLGTCGAMFLLGYSLNNLTLMALTIATGFVVDDAIVSQENISRYIERGEPPMQAALKGAGEIGFTIISLTVSLIAVLIPLLFMSDVVGRLFREFAVTLAITIVISALVSLTLVPMMAARMLRAEEDADPSVLARALQAGFDRLLNGYRQMLRWVLEHQALTLLVALVTLLLTVLLYIHMPKGLFPQQDTGRLQARVEAREGISFNAMASLQQAVARELLQDPDVASLSSQVGVGNGNPMLHTGSLLINLRTERSASQQAIMDRLRARAAQVPGASLYVQPVQDLTIDAETGPAQYRVALEGADNATVQRWTELLMQQLAHNPALRHVGSDVGVSAPSLMVSVDRDSASRLAVSAAAIDDALYNAFGQRIVSTIFSETNQFRVVLEAAPGSANSAQTLADIPIKTGSGKATTLGAIATVREQASPLQITRVGQFPATTIGFDTAPGVALEDAVSTIRSVAKEIAMPAAVTLNFLGAAGAFDAALENQLWLILAAVICVYIVLGVLYESYVHPLTILSTLPSAGVGALLALMLAGQDLGVIGVIGIILLIGIVKKNAIMMIDFAVAAEREQNKSPREAIEQAALLRFRPILMTTLAALFAALPLMLGWGEGAELRHPMGLAIFGGLLVSQLLTLFTTPVIYLGFDRIGRQWLGSSTQSSALAANSRSAPPGSRSGLDS